MKEILEAIIPIITALIGLLGNIWVYKNVTKPSQQAKKIASDLEPMQSSIDKTLSLNHIDTENSRYVNLLFEYTNYLLINMNDRDKKDILIIWTKHYIWTISTIIKTYSFEINSIYSIKNEMDDAFQIAMSEIINNMISIKIDLETHMVNYRNFTSTWESKAYCSPHKFKEEFIDACVKYFKVLSET